MQETFRAIITEMGGTPMSPMPTARAGLRHRAGRPHHPRGRRHAHGQRSDDVGAEQELPGARLPRTCSSPTAARSCRRPTRTDLDDPRAVDADERVHRRRAQSGRKVEGQPKLMVRRPWTHQSTHAAARCSRRAPVAAALRLDRGRGAAGAPARAGGAGGGAEDRRRRSSRSSSPRTSTRRCTLLVDLIIPKDERSGSATDAGVPEFMDFMMIDQPARQMAMRGGLAWLDRECQQPLRQDVRRAPTAAQRTAVLDDIAGLRRASSPSSSHGVAFFNSFRDLTASGFWTSKMGMSDLGYMGKPSSRNGTAARRRSSRSSA